MGLEEKIRGALKGIWEVPNSIWKKTNPVQDRFNFVDTGEKKYFISSLAKGATRGAIYGGAIGLSIGLVANQIAKIYGVEADQDTASKSILMLSGNFASCFSFVNVCYNAFFMKTLEINKIMAPFSYEDFKSEYLKELGK